MSTQVLVQSISEISLPRISPRKILLSGFILAAALLVFYVFQISEVTKASFFAVKYEKEITSLLEENKSLELSLSKGNSLANLETLLSRSDFQKVGNIHYIRIMESEVAVNPIH